MLLLNGEFMINEGPGILLMLHLQVVAIERDESVSFGCVVTGPGRI